MWQQALQDIDVFIWFGYSFCFFIWLTKQRVINSFVVSFSVVVLFNGLSSQIAPYLYTSFDDVALNRFVWYFSFAFSDALAIYAILKCHRLLDIKIHKSGVFVITVFFVLMLLQFARYVDRQIIKTDVLSEVYMYGIPAINILTLLYLVYTVSKNENKGS